MNATPSEVQRIVRACLVAEPEQAAVLLGGLDAEELRTVVGELVRIVDLAVERLADRHAITRRAVLRSLGIA